jgi:hypothetical protein
MAPSGATPFLFFLGDNMNFVYKIRVWEYPMGPVMTPFLFVEEQDDPRFNENFRGIFRCTDAEMFRRIFAGETAHFDTGAELPVSVLTDEQAGQVFYVSNGTGLPVLQEKRNG